MSRPPPAAPTHLLRSHTCPVSALWITPDNERIYSGDSDGKVAVTSTRSLRAITIWNAHTDGVLGVEEVGEQIITQGRDNKLHVWTRIEEPPPSKRLGGSAALPDLPVPTLVYSMDVNALNYCRFSLISLSTSEPSTLIALPNLVDSTTADIWSLPQRDRLHAAIGQETNKPVFSAKPDAGRGSNGIIMSLHLFLAPNTSSGASSSSSSSAPSTPTTSLRLLCGYESGSAILRQYTRSERPTSIEGQGWDTIWTSKVHVETITAMALSRSNTFALAVSADNLITKYHIGGSDSKDPKVAVHRTKHSGNGSIAIREDGKVFAVGGWDGCIRLYSSKSFKPLGTLRYHKSNIQAVAFAHPLPSEEGSAKKQGIEESDSDSDDDDLSPSDRAKISRWLVAGSKDTRVSVWELMSFESKST